MPNSQSNEEIDEIIQDSFIGLYARDEDGNFVPVDDKYNVLSNRMREAINQYVTTKQIEVLKIVRDDGQASHAYIKANELIMELESNALKEEE